MRLCFFDAMVLDWMDITDDDGVANGMIELKLFHREIGLNDKDEKDEEIKVCCGLYFGNDDSSLVCVTDFNPIQLLLVL